MSRSTDIEEVLRVIARAAESRRPLAPDLRERGGALAEGIAAALERGEDLPTAFAGLLPEDLRAALRGPSPPLERSALFAAEQLRLDRAAWLAWVDALAHPTLTFLAITAAMLLLANATGLGIALPWLVASIAVLATGAGLVAAARTGRLAGIAPTLAAFAYHAGQAQRFERAGLVARWRLTEAEIAPLLGRDLGAVAPILAHEGAEAYCRRLAGYHAAAAVRARRRLSFALAAVVYVSAGALVIAAAAPPLAACVETMVALGDDGDAPLPGGVATPGAPTTAAP